MNNALSNTGHFNFLDTNNYAAGGGLPDGYWAMWFDWFFRTTDANGKPLQNGPNLGLRATCINLEDPNAAPKEQIWSGGGNFHKSFMPDPDTAVEGLCKKLKPVPGGPGMTGSSKSNLFIFFDNLKQCGLPEGLEADDLSTLDGIWLHTVAVDEPEERKTFQSNKRATAEIQGQEEQRGPRKIPVPTEILPGGEPWNGVGGMPTQAMSFAMAPTPPAAPVIPTAPARAAAPRPGNGLAGRPTTVTPPAAPARAAAPAAPKPGRPGPRAAAAPVADAADMSVAAIDVVSTVLGSNPNGMTHLKMRLDTVKTATAKYGAEMATAVVETYFSNLEAINGLLGQVGYASDGTNVRVAA